MTENAPLWRAFRDNGSATLASLESTGVSKARTGVEVAIRAMQWGRTCGVEGRRVARLVVAAGVGVMSMPLLAGTASADDFSNTNPIVIPGPPPPAGCPNFPPPNNSCPSTTATPYPSPIAVAGLTGTITEVHVTLKGLTHEGPADLDVMLEAPDGKTMMLMSDVCAADTNENPITSAIDLTFADSATAPIPADTACAAGGFKPFDDEDDPEFPFTGPDSFPAPAPAPATAVTLSTLNGSVPNGTWNLWVVDDTPGTVGANSGQFAGGWTLSIATPNTAALTPPPGTPTTPTGSTTPTTAAPTATTAPARTAGGTRSQGSAPRATGTPLPDTGSSTQSLVTVAVLLMAGGWVLVRLARPRTAPQWPRTARR